MKKEKASAYSPDTVLEDFFLRSPEFQTDSSKPSTSEPRNDVKPDKQSPGFFQFFRNKSKRKLAALQYRLTALNLSKRFSCGVNLDDEFLGSRSPLIDPGLNHFKPQWKNFTFPQLQAATNNFSPGNLIGKGGYAQVYKGSLHGGRLIAVKQLTRGPVEERIFDFLSEIGMMAHVNHPNTAGMIGYGIEGGLYLVLEFSPLGSLASVLQNSKKKLEWEIRYKIALGVAKGLLYLHEGCQRRIIHRDIKAANILLSEDFEPQICDFGLAKWLPGRWNHLTVSKFEGTFGYLAPEFLMHGIVDEKTDVFAFGVVMLELITGRRALDYSQQSLVIWAKPLLKKYKIGELVDPSLSNNYDATEMNGMILAASLCVQRSSIKRPRMSQVLMILRGSCGGQDMVWDLSRWRKWYEQLSSSEEEQCSTQGLSSGVLNLQRSVSMGI